MGGLGEQLLQLHADLTELVNRDPEQEIGGSALTLVDAVISEARNSLPVEHPLSRQVVEIISAETIEAGEPIRAADALVVVGQLLAAIAGGGSVAHRDADRRLYADLINLWPSASVLSEFLRDHDLALRFRWAVLAPMETFVQDWDNAERAFHDPELELARRALRDAAESFLRDLSMESGPARAEGWQEVVPPGERDDFRLYESRWSPIVDRLNQSATQIWELHQDLVQLARTRLAL